MTRFLYALAWIIATPLVLARLALRSRRQPGYLEHLGERFGSYPPAKEGAYIWIHAVSVGETRAAVPLVEALRARHPKHNILVTHMTPTGRATSLELFGDRVERAWAPYDLAFAVRRFVSHYKPQMGIVLETEIWPRLFEEAARAGIPVMLANGRLSEKSAGRYKRAPALARWALSNLAGVAAQTTADARRFEEIGASNPAVTGNVKFDLAVPEAMVALGRTFRERFGAQRIIWVAGSTRDGEEALLLDALATAQLPADVLLVIVPRHPQRFQEVAQLAQARGFNPVLRSADAPVPSSTRVVVGDTMGEMLAYYAAADVVIMGGSLLEFGGQNLIEPCALGRPVIVGPHTYNFAEAADGAIDAGAALRVRDAQQALAAAASLDAAKRRDMGARASAFVEAHRGAVKRLVDWIEATAAKPR
jgi:3-deoxy-D-manno-octulosonic-acid transferase